MEKKTEKAWSDAIEASQAIVLAYHDLYLEKAEANDAHKNLMSPLLQLLWKISREIGDLKENRGIQETSARKEMRHQKNVKEIERYKKWGDPPNIEWPSTL